MNEVVVVFSITIIKLHLLLVLAENKHISSSFGVDLCPSKKYNVIILLANCRFNQCNVNVG